MENATPLTVNNSDVIGWGYRNLSTFLIGFVEEEMPQEDGTKTVK